MISWLFMHSNISSIIWGFLQTFSSSCFWSTDDLCCWLFPTVAATRIRRNQLCVVRIQEAFIPPCCFPYVSSSSFLLFSQRNKLRMSLSLCSWFSSWVSVSSLNRCLCSRWSVETLPILSSGRRFTGWRFVCFRVWIFCRGWSKASSEEEEGSSELKLTPNRFYIFKVRLRKSGFRF